MSLSRQQEIHLEANQKEHTKPFANCPEINTATIVPKADLDVLLLLVQRISTEIKAELPTAAATAEGQILSFATFEDVFSLTQKSQVEARKTRCSFLTSLKTAGKNQFVTVRYQSRRQRRRLFSLQRRRGITLIS